MPDYQTMGSNLFQLGHSGLVDDTADVFYAADIEEQVDVKTLLAESGFSSQGPSRGETLELPPLGTFRKHCVRSTEILMIARTM